jgi:hypothetical protein
MKRAELRHLARIGAEARLEALQREISAIYSMFPDLRARRSAPNPASEGVRQALQGAVTRRRPQLSAAARRRISEAQKARWAKHRAERADDGAAPHMPRGKASRKKK